MRLKEITINGQDWDIVENNKMRNYGICKPDKQEICIRTKEKGEPLKRKNVNDTIIHELLHAVLEEYSINHRKLKEEQLVGRLSKALVTVLEQILPGVDLYQELKKSLSSQ